MFKRGKKWTRRHQDRPLGHLPIKLRFEPQYSIIKPDDYWNFRFQIAPVIPNPIDR